MQLLLQQNSQLIDQVEVARVRQRDVQVPVLRIDGHEVVPEHQVHRDRMEQIVIDADFAQIHKIAAVARCQRFGLRDLVGRLDNLERVSSGHKGSWNTNLGNTRETRNTRNGPNSRYSWYSSFLSFERIRQREDRQIKRHQYERHKC